MTAADIIRAAVPDADEMTCEHVLWGMTPYPCGPVTPQELYQAASRYRRAKAAGRVLCECCHNQATPGQFMCGKCAAVVRGVP